SDAVILKKTNYSLKPKILKKNEEFIIADKATLANTLSTDLHKGFIFQLQKNEEIFGGGERALSLNRRGHLLQLYNNPWYGYSEGAENLNYSVPFFTSNKGYALFFDNVAKSYVDIGKKNSDLLEYGTESGALIVYIILGDDYKAILKNFYELTGTQPLPPRWALGNLMSRFGYTSEKQVKDIYERMQTEKIPVDAVIFDLFWFGDSIKNGMGNLDWVNKQKWPNPKKMIDYFHQNKVKTILVTEPFVVKNTLAYPSSKPYLSIDSNGKPYEIEDFYFGNAGLIDIFRKDAQNWFWKYYDKQMKLGVEAWWGDLGEPEKHPTNMFHQLKDVG
ncbi:MAG: TIM-barrel domain-containing protein, partial [Chitinophagaceae bacterium]